MKLVYTKGNILKGAIVYGSGDALAALIQSDFNASRIAGLMALGATLYAFEVPNWFRYIEEKTKGLQGLKASFTKTLMAMLYFNPLWIARHLFFIMLFSGQIAEVSIDLLRIAGLSFLVNVPISIVANYLIQNVVKLEWRFMASALFSAAMAIYYALSATWFG